ncbi:MAG: LPS export ABC transporter periplasmic protein LptC [Balneolales bacterium]
MRFLFPILFLLMAAACTDLSEYDKDRIDEALTDSLLSVTESWDIQMEIIEDGFRIVNIRAPYAATYHEEDSETSMRGPVEVIVRDTLGNQITQVNSNRAIYTGRDSKFQFRGDVVVVTEEGRILRTQELDWMQQDRKISSTDFVTITTSADSLAGYGLSGQDDLSVYTISEVTGEFELD